MCAITEASRGGPVDKSPDHKMAKQEENGDCLVQKTESKFVEVHSEAVEKCDNTVDHNNSTTAHPNSMNADRCSSQDIKSLNPTTYNIEKSQNGLDR